MTNEDAILRELSKAQKHIREAKDMIRGETPPPPADVVDVLPGDNLLTMIADHPEHTVFELHDEFVQDCGQAEFAKPCTVGTQRGRLIAILAVKPQTHLIGLTIDGATTGTILTGADGVTLDACVLNGNAAGQHRGILANAKGMRIRTTKILNIQRDIDTQAIAGWDRTDDLVVSACHLEASGENFLLGGDSSSSADNMPRNVTLTGCYLSKRPEWRASAATCKNLVELKVGDTVAMVDNVLDYSFVDGQIGYAVVLTVRNEYGSSPWSTIRNVLFRNNLIRHVAGGFQILGRDDRGGQYPSVTMSGVTLQDNTIEDLSANRYGGNGKQIFISGGPDHLVIDGNSFTCPDAIIRRSGSETPHSALCFDQPQYVCTNLVITNQRQFVEGAYGIFGTSAPGLGTPVLDMYAPGYTWVANTVKSSGSNINWPPGTVLV